MLVPKLKNSPLSERIFCGFASCEPTNQTGGKSLKFRDRMNVHNTNGMREREKKKVLRDSENVNFEFLILFLLLSRQRMKGSKFG